jgi:hypothetical protein
MYQTLTDVQELNDYAEERLADHFAWINQVPEEDKDQRKRVYNERLINYIDELNSKCRELYGVDCNGGNKSLHSVINEYQNKFIAQYYKP